MKFFKSTLAIVALCVTGSMFAARTKTEQTAVETTQVAAKPVVQKRTTTQRGRQPRGGRQPKGGKVTPAPVQQVAVTAKTYKQLVDDVKGARDAWNSSTKKLNGSFTDRIASSALAADLEDYQLDSLLQIARDYHAIFTGKPSEDRNLLSSLAQDRQAIVEWFNMAKRNASTPVLSSEAL